MTEPKPVLDSRHLSVPGYRQRMTSAEVRALLLNGPETLVWKGNLYDMQKKSLGFGLYDVWFEESKYGDE